MHNDSVSLAPILTDPAKRVRTHVVCSAVHGLTAENSSRETAVIFAAPNEETGNEMLLKGRWVENPRLSVDTEEFFDLDLDRREREPLHRDDSLDERYREPFATMERIYRDYLAR